MVRLPKIMLMVIALLGVGLAQAGVVYKWTDDQGIVQYTDQAPKDREYTVIKSSGLAPPSAKEALEKREKQLAEEAEARKQSEIEGLDYAAQQKIRDEQARIRAENCKNAKTNLKTIESNARVRILGEDGEFRYLTEEERQSQIDRAQEVIDSNCEA